MSCRSGAHKLRPQFTCFTSTNVQILPQKALLLGIWLLAGAARAHKLRAQFTCFTSTKVQMLTQKALLGVSRAARACLSARANGRGDGAQVLSLLALLVQTCKVLTPEEPLRKGERRGFLIHTSCPVGVVNRWPVGEGFRVGQETGTLSLLALLQSKG